jgi:hypothetical protein
LVVAHDLLGDANEEREEAGSLAALGMTTRKAKAKAKAEAEAEADSLRE